jgi:ABC-type lipoprotein release transport system permease subunit
MSPKIKLNSMAYIVVVIIIIFLVDIIISSLLFCSAKENREPLDESLNHQSIENNYIQKYKICKHTFFIIVISIVIVLTFFFCVFMRIRMESFHEYVEQNTLITRTYKIGTYPLHRHHLHHHHHYYLQHPLLLPLHFRLVLYYERINEIIVLSEKLNTMHQK